MKKANIVIGLGWGDEGKGITTDYLCSKATNPIVIRFSGGQQAGHTVMIGDKKHIFSNFGAGTLRGVPTYFSEYTTFYPKTILKEKLVLKEKGIKNPQLILHPLAKMTTPFDVFANRNCDNNLAHGTCGLGIGKTMKRNEGPYKLYAIDLLHKTNLLLKLEQIGKYYENLGYDFDADIQEEMESFIEAVMDLSWDVQDYNFLKNYDELIFEGSQGVLLDMDHGVFPNVTYSNTTSKNVHILLDKLQVYQREIFYITRCYHTRHGAGFFNKNKSIDLVNNEEETCVYNKYQKE
ncbi:MAG: adenylosuccinate synthetase, partial [Polaribacter sp.]